MNKLFVEMKLVSPAFVGGADQERAELRVASLRGLLRFWWRAAQPPMSVAELQKRESELFGATDIGQSKFLMRVTADRTQVAGLQRRLGPGAAYLSYGIDPKRTALQPGGTFTLQLLFKKGATERKDELLDALWCLTHLGGMGSRSRRGFGSMVVTGIEGADFPALPRSPEDLKGRIEGKFRQFGLREREDLPDYTALSCHTAVVVWPLRTESWEQALQKVGEGLSTFRSSQAEHPRYLGDRDLISGYVYSGTKPTRSPERAAFGLPHNYFFKQTRTQVNVSGTDHDRRASPLFIHLHELGNGEITAILSLIPARFLPEREQVKIGPAGRRQPQYVPAPPGFSAVEEFLSTLDDALEVKV